MMTVIDERADASGPTPQPGSRPRRRPLVLAVVLLAALLLAVGAVVAWHVSATAARAGVVVLSDQRALTCSPSADATTTTTEADDVDGPSLVVPAIRLNGPVDCRMTFVIDNTGTHPVTVRSVHLAPMLPIAGLRTGAVGLAGPVGVPFELGPGEATSVDIGLSWRSGCLARNGTDTRSGTPTLDVVAEGLSGTVAEPGPSYALLGTAASETRCPWKR